ncbi:Conserved_hypothetical protein [Hexamita inflata]|uniref:Uncharacterized protein n=1 Tax=Hexamita inflata TaxID=28002 RepID=A0AA86PIQ8_9EUKA|nr:Conserved hypothetical protein [Hexamita inflata]
MTDQFHIQTSKIQLKDAQPVQLLVTSTYVGYVSNNQINIQINDQISSIELSRQYTRVYATPLYILCCSGEEFTDIFSTTTLSLVLTKQFCVTSADQDLVGTLSGDVYQLTDTDAKLVVQLDSEVVQVQKVKSVLLASTLTKLVLMPLFDPIPVQVGSKPRKNTRHGGCCDTQLCYAVRPNNKIFVFDRAQQVVTATLSLKESIQNFTDLDCVPSADPESIDTDFGLMELIDKQLALVYTSQTIFIVDLSLPAVLSSFYVKNVNFCVSSSRIVFQRLDEIIIQKIQPGPAPIAPKKAPKIVEKEPIVEKPVQKTQLIKNYSPFSIFSDENEKEPVKIEYKNSLKVIKPKINVKISPLTSYFQFLKQDEKEDMLSSEYFKLSETAGIQKIQIESTDLDQINQETDTLNKLNKFAVELAPQYIQLLAQSERTDPLYPHVKQFISALATKSVISLAAFEDIQSEQPFTSWYRKSDASLDDFEEIIFNFETYPEDYKIDIKNRINMLKPLLGPYAIHFVGLLYHIPDIFSEKYRDNDLASQQLVFCKQCHDYDLSNVPEMEFNAEIILSILNNQPTQQVADYIEQVHKFKQSCKEVFQQLYDNYYNLVLTQNIKRKDKYIILGLLSDNTVITMACFLKFLITNKISINFSQDIQIVSKFLKEIDCDEMHDAIQDWINQSFTTLNIYHLILMMLYKLNAQHLIINILACLGHIHEVISIAKTNKSIIINSYKLLLRNVKPDGVLDLYKQAGLITQENVQQIIKESIGYIKYDLLKSLAIQFDCLNIKVLRNLISVK